MLPPIAILVITYNRANTLQKTLRLLHEHVMYSGDQQYFVADDGSTDGTQAMIKEWGWRGIYPKNMQLNLIQSDRKGLGANANAGLRAAFEYSPIVLQLQDDMQPTKPLLLDAHVQKLQDDPLAGFIRLWGVAGHKYKAELDGGYWGISWDSPEHYIASDRPHIKHKRFHEAVGLYPEGRTTGDTEEAWCHQVRAVVNSGTVVPRVFVPLIDTEYNFEHVCYGQRWRDEGL